MSSNAAGVVVAGYVEGNIAAKELVEVKSSGQVRGDIGTSKLVVIEGGIVDGHVSMRKEGAKVVDLREKVKEGSAQ